MNTIKFAKIFDPGRDVIKKLFLEMILNINLKSASQGLTN
jgi:hypothetical protein